ncbi:MAG: MBOAT family protein, partial [Muribaculaceae bacterium]|nr:MBOAT family protein [Muribaculaceae bacterium]
GYSIDVMRGNVTPTHNLVGFFTYIAFFPQLVAGPIESARNLLPQILRKRQWNTQRSVDGLRMILFGLLKKLCVADMLAIYVDRIFFAVDLSPLHVLTGGILFSIQLYCDFSAYSEIARGCASLLGIRLMVNFRFPLFSRNILEFWRRWHISLMLWFRDYVYIPLGGNRKGKWRTIINYTVVFLLSGLWHGAAWNFVFWGAYWTICYIIGNNLLRLQRRPEGSISLTHLPNIVLTFGVVAFGFYIFRCDNVPLIITGLKNMWIYLLFFPFLYLTLKGLILVMRGVKLNITILAMTIVVLSVVMILAVGKGIYLLKFWWLLPALMALAIEWSDRNSEYPFSIVPRRRYSRYLLYWMMGTFIVLSEPTQMSFIYFQF